MSFTLRLVSFLMMILSSSSALCHDLITLKQSSRIQRPTRTTFERHFHVRRRKIVSFITTLQAHEHFELNTKIDSAASTIRDIELSPSSLPTSTTNDNFSAAVIPLRRLSDGSIVRPLRFSDTELVNSWWQYSSVTSLKQIRYCIEISDTLGSCCLGVETDNKLVASILRYPGGALGMLFVDPIYRRRGYAEALLKEASTRIMMAAEDSNDGCTEVKKGNHHCWALIRDGNIASEALFTKLRWERDDPTEKKRTGKRRANRKWIKRVNN